MMHRFSIDLPPAWQADEVPPAVLNMLETKARELGGQTSLGPRTGSGEMETPVGPVEIAYALESPQIWFEILKKPMLVPTQMIENGIRKGCEKYFTEYPEGLPADYTAS